MGPNEYAPYVAAGLRALAEQVESGAVLGLDFRWDGGEHVDIDLKAAKPADFITIDFKVEEGN